MWSCNNDKCHTGNILHHFFNLLINCIPSTVLPNVTKAAGWQRTPAQNGSGFHTKAHVLDPAVRHRLQLSREQGQVCAQSLSHPAFNSSACRCTNTSTNRLHDILRNSLLKGKGKKNPTCKSWFCKYVIPWRALRLLWILAPLIGNGRRFRAWKWGCFWMSPGLTIRNQITASLHCSVIQTSCRSRGNARAVCGSRRLRGTSPPQERAGKSQGTRGTARQGAASCPHFHGTQVSSHRATGVGTIHLFNACYPALRPRNGHY